MSDALAKSKDELTRLAEEQAVQLVREKLSDLNNALARAALVGLVARLDYHDAREMGRVPTLLVTIELSKRLL